MAIYSLHHSPVGKSTQAQAYTAAAHIKYITRTRALSRLAGDRMPTSSVKAMAYLRSAEDQDRKNARVIDKLMLALPRELNAAERLELVRSFAEAITQGRAPWLAAFHERGKDAQNPHCHLVIRDRDARTGKRVFGTSEKGSTERLRLLWEEHANAALEDAGRECRIDRRTLEAQGIHRAPTIHEGVRARRMHRERRKVRSRQRVHRNGAFAKSRSRSVDYPAIDKGRSRCAHNEHIRQTSVEREQDYWSAIDADRQHREIEALRAIHKPADHWQMQRASFKEYLAKRPVRRSKSLKSGRDKGRELDDD